MNLYVISQPEEAGYDEYEFAVVAAESEEAARSIHPDSFIKNWDGKRTIYGTWCAKEEVVVKHIGTAIDAVPGVICASFLHG